jgi:methionyl-tRNA synthetase
MLHAARFKLPTKVHIHGFLTVAGEKMSKSKGTFIKAATLARHLDTAALRYYYASKLGPRLDDLDLNLDEFVEKVNADLVGKVVNIASRCARFVQSPADDTRSGPAAGGLAAEYPEDGGLFAHAAAAGRDIADAYENCDYARAMRLIMELADRANAYIDSQRPWGVAKEPGRERDLQNICSIGLNAFRQLVIYLAPVLPRLADQAGRLLSDPIKSWSQAGQPLVGTPVAPFSHLMKRLDRKDVDAMIEESKEPETVGPAAQPAPAVNSYGDTDQALQAEPLAATCTIEEFAKIDLRVARVLAAEEVAGADKLLKLTVNFGGNATRTVFAGIKQAYRPDQLVGRLVVVVANLAPRKMKFGVSEGMVVASGAGGAEVFLLGVDTGAKPGQRVH